MARFVIANRRSGKFTVEEKIASRSAMASAVNFISSAEIVEDNDPDDETARRIAIVEADSAEVAAHMADFGDDVIVEPEILHWPSRTPPRDLSGAAPAIAAGPADAAAGVMIQVQGDAGPLQSCKLKIYVRGWSGTQKLDGITDAAGRYLFAPPAGMQVAAVLAIPAGGHWAMIARGASALEPIHCPALPRTGPREWWHHLVGAGNGLAGNGIRVGVIDTGLARHACLAHAVALGAFIEGQIDLTPAAAVDVEGHGTHVAGTIGGRPANAGDYAGIAPDCELFAARVFAPGQGASNADIANAIDALSRDRQVDLINMSLSSSMPSQIVRESVIDAAERGTLCLVAAGNEAGSVHYPAAFSECVAVSALGLAGWGPPGSLSASRLPEQPDRFGRDNLYLANFSCFGPEIDCAAPGVGILAPVCDAGGSDLFFAGMDGTSMATPVACGALAALLSGRADYLGLPRSIARSAAARTILAESLRDIGLATSLQGRGVPYIS